jgi:hypothetical protein
MAGVVRALEDRELLIVLDSCEHILGSASRVVVNRGSVSGDWLSSMWGISPVIPSFTRTPRRG